MREGPGLRPPVRDVLFFAGIDDPAEVVAGGAVAGEAHAAAFFEGEGGDTAIGEGRELVSAEGK